MISYNPQTYDFSPFSHKESFQLPLHTEGYVLRTRYQSFSSNLFQINLPFFYFHDLIVFLLAQIILIHRIDNQFPNEQFYNGEIRPNLKHFQPFGCPAYVVRLGFFMSYFTVSMPPCVIAVVVYSWNIRLTWRMRSLHYSLISTLRESRPSTFAVMILEFIKLVN